MTHGRVCLAVSLQHGTWSIFCTLYTKEPSNSIALVFADFALMVPPLVFLLYETFLLFALSIHFIFSYIFMIMCFN